MRRRPGPEALLAACAGAAEREFATARVTIAQDGGIQLFPEREPEPPCGVGLTQQGTTLIGKSNLRPDAPSPTALGERLFAGFSMPVPTDGNYSSVMEAVCRSATAGGRGTLIVPNRTDPGLLMAGTPDGSGGAAGTVDRGWKEDAGSGWIRFQYRTEAFLVPERWLQQWVRDWAEVYEEGYDSTRGDVGSVNDTLDMLWFLFRASAYSDPEDYDDLLSCYDVHRRDWEGRRYWFWTEGAGAPREMFRLTAQLVATYWEFSDYSDELDPRGPCGGFPEFLRDMVRGHTARRSEVASSVTAGVPWECSLAVNYRGPDTYPAVGPPCFHGEDQARCSEGYTSDCPGTYWRDSEAVWLEDRSCWAPSLDWGICSPLRTSCGGGGIGGGWNVTLHPQKLAFSGLVADRLLHLARLCYDYGRSHTSAYAEYYRTASRIARYALGIAAEAGETWVHEVGHVYLGGGHCSNDHRCCFDNDANAWLCRVRATLGLPKEAYSPTLNWESDFDNPNAIYFDSCDNCGSDGAGVAYKTIFCYTVLDGSIGEQAVFAVSDCSYQCGETASETQRKSSAKDLPEVPDRRRDYLR